MRSPSVQQAIIPARPLRASLLGASSAEPSARLRGALVLLPCYVIILTAWCLTPRSCGYGTHRQLGLPGCSFLARTGLPCPSCGLTTSVSAAVHGRLGLALRAHPFGPVLLAAVAALAVMGGYELLTGRGMLNKLRLGPWTAGATIAALLVGWAIKLAIGLASGELPMR